MKARHLLLVSAFALLCAGLANAQTQPWNENRISFTPPTTCTTGEPISACAVTGYRVERSATTTGPFTAVGSPTGSPFIHTGAVAGLNCYRVIAISANGESAPSLVTPSACKTNVRPVGPPSPPTNTTVVEPIAYNVKPDYQRFAIVRGARAGTIRLGAACDEARVTADGYSVISRPSQVQPRPAAGTVLVARCA